MTDNPYQAPQANLVREQLPFAFLGSGLTSAKLRLAGWLSVVNLLLGIGTMVVLAISAFSHSDLLASMGTALVIFSSLVWIYLILIFQRFVETRCQVTGLGLYVKTLIALTLVLTVLDQLMNREYSGDGVPGIATVLYFATLIPYGVFTVLLGRRLVKAPHPIPFLKALGWITIIIGAGMASLVLAVLVLPLFLVSSVLSALMFFQGARELHSQASV